MTEAMLQTRAMKKNRRIVFGIIFTLLGSWGLYYGLGVANGLNGKERFDVAIVTWCCGGGSLIAGLTLLYLGLLKGPDPTWLGRAVEIMIAVFLACVTVFFAVESVQDLAPGAQRASEFRADVFYSVMAGLMTLGAMHRLWSTRKQ